MAVVLARGTGKQLGMEFERGRFGRWLRLLLCAFYGGEERVVADLLCRREALLRDTVIAEILGLPERQVRQALERRLVPDCLVERRTDGEGEKSKTFYRISPVSVAVTALRLQLLEDKLSIITEDRYECPECHRAYDSLQAMSLAGRQTLGEDGGSTFAFMCPECEGEDGEGLELVAVGDSKAVQCQRLQRFRLQCRDLLLLTREIKDMQVPAFTVEENEKEKVALASTVVGEAVPTAAATAVVDWAGPVSTRAGNPAGGGSVATTIEMQPVRGSSTHEAYLDEWLCHEVLQQQRRPNQRGSASLGSSTDGPRLLCVEQKDTEEELREALRRAREEHIAQAMRSARGSASGLDSRLRQQKSAHEASHEPSVESMVTVQGRPYKLARVRSDEELQDSMTDAEYQSFVDLAREEDRRQTTALRRALPPQ